MGRLRKKVDIVLSLAEVRRIRRGYIHSFGDHHLHSIYIGDLNHLHSIYMEDNKKARKIARLEKELRLLRNGGIDGVQAK